ncbi:somatotropin [Lampris incognitus]|uniref:somatotropin n=1 Tax=Lampris incognitus TaxID=2546036 RepID=UPI0024B4AB2C|nr:somatotropin [Lampris incognitus]
MERVCLCVSVLLLGVFSGSCAQPLSNSQRLFSIAVSRVQHLHLLAKNVLLQFESSLQTDEQRQLNKIFLQDSCNSDYIISPIDKHETQHSSVLRLLSISYRLIGSWETASRDLSGAPALRNQIYPKITELKTGIDLLIRANQGPSESYNEDLQQALYGNYYQAGSLGMDESLRHTYELLACFKKDMHKVETYLTVAKCRLFPEANCTL